MKVNKERTYEFRIEIETLDDVLWSDCDVIIVNGKVEVIDGKFYEQKSHIEKIAFLTQKVADYKFVEFENGKVVALVQTKN